MLVSVLVIVGVVAIASVWLHASVSASPCASICVSDIVGVRVEESASVVVCKIVSAC